MVTLLKTAREPPEHRRIAAYYRAEAVRLDESANEHAELLNIHQQPHPSKQQTMVGQEATHCQKLVELTKEQAKEARELAVLHDEMATAAEQKQLREWRLLFYGSPKPLPHLCRGKGAMFFQDRFFASYQYESAANSIRRQSPDTYRLACAVCIDAIRSCICRVRCGVMPSIRSITINCPR